METGNKFLTLIVSVRMRRGGVVYDGVLAGGGGRGEGGGEKKKEEKKTRHFPCRETGISRDFVNS